MGGFVILCPWHKERTPSCSVQLRDGAILAHCHACGAGGDVFALIAAVRGLDPATDFPRVIEAARELACMPEPSPAQDEPKHEERAVTTVTFHAIVRPLLHLRRLDDSPIAGDATEYLRARGLLDATRADGWACLPSAPPTQRRWIRMLLDCFDARDVDGCGFIRGDGFSFPGNRLVIPWRDPSGLVDNIQRRRLDAQHEKKYTTRGQNLRQEPLGGMGKPEDRPDPGNRKACPCEV